QPQGPARRPAPLLPPRLSAPLHGRRRKPETAPRKSPGPRPPQRRPRQIRPSPPPRFQVREILHLSRRTQCPSQSTVYDDRRPPPKKNERGWPVTAHPRCIRTSQGPPPVAKTHTPVGAPLRSSPLAAARTPAASAHGDHCDPHQQPAVHRLRHRRSPDFTS